MGRLWSSTGQQLATATFTNETASGWQQVNFATPVAITANTVYVASYHAPNGRYAINTSYFASSGQDRAPLHALQNGVSGGNGVYVYGASPAFPTSTFQSSNYWVDVVFVSSLGPDTTAPTVTITTPTSAPTFSTGTTPLNLGGTASDNVGVTQVSWTNDRGGSGVASGTTTWSVSGVPLQSGVNLITVTARDAANNPGTATLSVTYTPDTTAPTVTGQNAGGWRDQCGARHERDGDLQRGARSGDGQRRAPSSCATPAARWWPRRWAGTPPPSPQRSPLARR